jgi:hypothetical protein
MTERYEWQYNGAAPIDEILDWCHENLPNDSGVYAGFETIWFRNREAYSYFLLRWI